MTEKLEKKVSKVTLTTTVLDKDVRRGRGRPKGAKNKIRSFVPPEAVLPKRGRGRPKGAKNKSKTPQTEDATLLVKHKPREPSTTQPSGKKRGRPRKLPLQSEEPIVVKIEQPQTDSLDGHPLLLAVKWIEKNMHPTEVDYYRRRASRNSVPLHCAMVSDILGFFNVQNAEICKQIKKNNFIVSNSNGLPN